MNAVVGPSYLFSGSSMSSHLMHRRHRGVQELEIIGETGSLMLTNFSQLKQTAPTEKWIVKVRTFDPRSCLPSSLVLLEKGRTRGLAFVNL